MWFETPISLFWLLLLPLVVVLRKKGWGQPAALLFPETASVRAAFHGGRRPGSGFSEGLRLTAAAALILACAQPQWIQNAETITTSGLDVMLAMDISGSMSARDFEPLNRLQAAKEVLRDFLKRARQDRVGLIAFAARAYNVCPLTLDYHVLLMLLDHLDIGMTTDGTAIGMALATSVNRLKATAAQSKVIILLTDGRNNMGAIDPLTAAAIAAALKIRIYTIGMGQPGGGPIVVPDAVQGQRVLLNADGSVHMEQVDEGMLKQIAVKTGGQYFRATDQNKLKEIYSAIRRLEYSRLTSKHYTDKKDIGPIFLSLAFLLLLSEWILVPLAERRLP